uniref:Esculentin-2HB2 antimicrobial peptide n=1 Tax=Pelophylax hubeiensis TaxID=121165 RepID=A0A0A0RAC1_9NEOB|nr:esculentin-2HB2 antimicrobial peptide precursor [Pelophylax hubeiensis]
MFTSKKPLLLFFFLGTISLSLCKEERDADEDDGGEMKEELVKRGFFSLFSTAAKFLGKTLLKQAGKAGAEAVACKATNQC